jgi:hypothetical protein
MPIDINNNFDQATLRRIANLEERIRDILTAQTRFVTNTQTNELLTLISTELATIRTTLDSLERRISILEDIPEIN